MKRTALLYLLVVTVVGLGIFAVLHLGSKLPQPAAINGAATAASPASHAAATGNDSFFGTVSAGLRQSAGDPLNKLFLQLLVIICAARLAGWIMGRLGQPPVVGEMIAGILLGPSLFGLVTPGAFAFVFPAASLGALKLFSQIGVCLFMFAVGMELDVSLVRKKAHTAVFVSHASIIIPYFLGVTLALFLYSSYAQPGASFTAFALFMGISMSITAFPVLVRILQDRGVFKTMLGTTATACAAVDDVTAWTMLAFVVALVRATSMGVAAFNVALTLAFVMVMLCVVKPALPRWFGREALERPDPGKGTLAIVVGVVLASALCTELIGIHALFGAFLAGVIMPETGDFRHKLGVRIENFSSVLLLPLFFAFTGLRTQIGLLDSLNGWLACGAVVVVATSGKLGGSAVTARLTGMPWRESLQLGALMNTRGLMELIALNIGYDLGILSPRIFAMLVIMALVTTLMTGPLFTWFGKLRESGAIDGFSRAGRGM
jgi:Kef-type K+ transport system membrane component KefB